MIRRRHLPQNFVCARSCGFGMEGCNRYAHGFPTPSATGAVKDDGDVTSSPPAAVLAQEVFAFSKPQVLSSHRTGCGENRWGVRCKFRRGRGGERERHFSLYPTTKDPTWTTQATRMGAENSVDERTASCGSATLLGWCCPPTEELSCQRKLLLFADWIRVPTCSWSRKRTLSNCSTLPSVCAVAHGSLPPREEELPRNSAKRNRHKKVLPRVTCTTHRVPTAAQPARRRDDTRKKAVNRVLEESWPTCSPFAVKLLRSQDRHKP